jgi:hypothetical protein
VQEVIAYQTYLELLTADDAVRRALDTLLAKGSEAFLAELQSEETRARALKLLRRVTRYLQANDASVGEGRRRALAALAAGLERVIEATGDAARLRQRLDELLAEMNAAADDPLAYLREQTLGAIVERMTAELAKRFGAKAAGSLASMAADLAALVDALQQKAAIDDLRRQLVELRRRLVAAARADPCYTLDATWLAGATKEIRFPAGWQGHEVELSAHLYCCTDERPPRFVECTPPPVTIAVGSATGAAVKATVPAVGAGERTSALQYSLAIGPRRCGSDCFVEIQVKATQGGQAFGMFIGALPTH